MISLLVDEAYAFDYLSILYIKKERNIYNYNEWKNCEQFLKSQYDDNTWNTIINSEEFKNLIRVNNELFDSVEQAKNNNISAKALNDKNIERFSYKQIFQKNLFPYNSLIEIKTL